VDEYCPPLHLQQLRRALVSKDELKQVEQVIKQVPAKKLALRTIEELSRRIQRYSREEMKETVLRFAGDFFRLHRDLRDAEQAKEVAGKAQHGFLHFLARVALDSPG